MSEDKYRNSSRAEEVNTDLERRILKHMQLARSVCIHLAGRREFSVIKGDTVASNTFVIACSTHELWQGPAIHVYHVPCSMRTVLLCLVLLWLYYQVLWIYVIYPLLICTNNSVVAVQSYETKSSMAKIIHKHSIAQKSKCKYTTVMATWI